MSPWKPNSRDETTVDRIREIVNTYDVRKMRTEELMSASDRQAYGQLSLRKMRMTSSENRSCATPLLPPEYFHRTSYFVAWHRRCFRFAASKTSFRSCEGWVPARAKRSFPRASPSQLRSHGRTSIRRCLGLAHLQRRPTHCDTCAEVRRGHSRRHRAHLVGIHHVVDRPCLIRIRKNMYRRGYPTIILRFLCEFSMTKVRRGSMCRRGRLSLIP